MYLSPLMNLPAEPEPRTDADSCESRGGRNKFAATVSALREQTKNSGRRRGRPARTESLFYNDAPFSQGIPE